MVPRCVRYTGAEPELPERILELEAEPANGFDAVVQNVLPTSMEYAACGRNVAYFFCETSDFRGTAWPRHLKLMDEVWVPCRHNLAACRESGVDAACGVVPVACDVSKFERSYEPHRLRAELGDDFVFYTIGEATRRKNLNALAAAFHLEFEPSEPVSLVVKTSLPGVPPDRARGLVRAEFERVKVGLNLYPDPRYYKREMVITDRLSDESVRRLHHSCDCYVSPSFGEGWGLPCFDAMGFGKTPIVTAYGAHLEYVTPETGWLVPGNPVPVSGMQDVHGDLYTGRQSWCSVDVAALRKAMREAYEDRGLREKKSTSGTRKVYEFDRPKVGGLMRKLLEDGAQEYPPGRGRPGLP